MAVEDALQQQYVDPALVVARRQVPAAWVQARHALHVATSWFDKSGAIEGGKQHLAKLEAHIGANLS